MSAVGLRLPGFGAASHDGAAAAGNSALSRALRVHRARRRVSGRRLRRFAGAVMAMAEQTAGLTDAQIARRAREEGTRLRRRSTREAALVPLFALVREAARRALDTPHYPVQLMGGLVLYRGLLAEMATGEGKTLTVTLAAAAAALAGAPVHVVTANDYLAARDAQQMAPLYRALGLTVAAVSAELDPDARRTAYACDICYCSAKQLVFDHLRDRLAARDSGGELTRRLLGQGPGGAAPLLRGFGWAIVDEADSVLIDQACTPLRLSRSRESRTERDLLVQALVVAEWLDASRDYRIDPRARQVTITASGRQRIAERTAPMGGLWTGERRREALVRQALTARHLLERNHHYLVRKGRVVLIDEQTGRPTPERRLAEGLHELVEVKEDCRLSARSETLASTSFQRFFARYPRLGALSGTAREVGRELASVYGLGVVPVATRLPSRRVALPRRVFADAASRWQAVAEMARETSRQGRPVLVGTRSLAESEALSALLGASGVEHQVLNARQDREEACIVERAGRAGCVTVATNMAGRGTDIKISPGVVEAGGLLVIAAQPNESARVDRQLAGRAARQGDPGSVQACAAMDDELFVTWAPGWPRALAAWLAARAAPAPARWLAGRLTRIAQRRAGQAAAARRRALLEEDTRMDDLLAFTGAPD